MKKSEETLRTFMGHHQVDQYLYYRAPRRRKHRERKGQKHIQRNNIEKFLNLEKETDIHIQEAQRAPNKMNTTLKQYYN